MKVWTACCGVLGLVVSLYACRRPAMTGPRALDAKVVAVAPSASASTSLESESKIVLDQLESAQSSAGCAQVLASSGGFYTIGGQSPHVVMLHGAAPFSKSFPGALWLAGAAHPKRPELVLIGGYAGHMPELGPDAPRVGLFALRLNEKGEVVWRRSLEHSNPEELRIYEEDLVLEPDGRLLEFGVGGAWQIPSLFGVAHAGDQEREYLTRLDFTGARNWLRPAGVGEVYLSIASDGLGAVYATTRGAHDVDRLLRIDADGRLEWTRDLRDWPGALAADGVGGVWLATEVHVTSSHSNARALHYHRDGRVLEAFSLGDAQAPNPFTKFARQAMLDFQPDGQGRLWLLGHFSVSMALGEHELFKRYEGQKFLAALDKSLRTLAVLPVDLNVNLASVGAKAVAASEDDDGICSLRSLSVWP
ncbi:MAG: hypothetical protein QM756_03270 [Polyangiaceae bacterium]